MKNQIIISAILYFVVHSFVIGQEFEKESLAKGLNFIETRTYTAEEDAKVLELYKNLRVADVSDGMDMVGLPGTGLIDQVIHPSWVDLKDFSHIFRGIAITVRYVPSQKSSLPPAGEDFEKWEGKFYNAYSHEGFTKLIRPGSAIIIDDVEEKDIGSIGSNNILYWYKLGATGIVTDAGARDTDEVGLEKVPLYIRNKGRGIRPGRNEIESVNRPVSIGGVLVCPGDIIIGDGDGVIVVPRTFAEKVAIHANKILIKDKEGRKSLYESLGRTLDKTVQ